MQRFNRSSTHLVIILLFAFTSIGLADKENHFELRGGLANYRTQVTNRVFNFAYPSVDITFSKDIGYMQSVLNIGFFGATTNALQTVKNGDSSTIITNARPTNRYFIARAFSLEFAEYFPFSFFNDKLKLSPGIAIKFAHYNDTSAGRQFLKPTRDYMYTFLRLALKVEAHYLTSFIGAEYRYPIFGSLTDKILKENRYETYLNIYVGYSYSDIFAKFGYDYSKLTYHTPLFNSESQRYLYRSLGTLYLSVGVNF